MFCSICALRMLDAQVHCEMASSSAVPDSAWPRMRFTQTTTVAGTPNTHSPSCSQIGMYKREGPICARRLQAAVTQETVTMKYKTEACAHRPCRRGAECWFYHSEEDRLPLLGYKSQFCKAWHVRADPLLHLATLSRHGSW